MFIFVSSLLKKYISVKTCATHKKATNDGTRMIAFVSQHGVCVCVCV